MNDLFRDEPRDRPRRFGAIYGVCLTLGATLAITANLCGCGGSGGSTAATYPVQGRVLLSNGKPLDSGRIAFVPRDVLSPPASGRIGPDGHFTLTTRTDGDGAVAGDYKVRIEPDSGSSTGQKRRKPGFPIKYVDEDSSGLSITVRAESNQLEPFRLK